LVPRDLVAQQRGRVFEKTFLHQRVMFLEELLQQIREPRLFGTQRFQPGRALILRSR
jgi:hypothetical protein